VTFLEKVTEGHSNWYRSKAWVRFLLAFHSNYGSILHHFRDKARYWSKIVIFSYPLAFNTPIGGASVGILPSHLVWKN